MTHKFDPAVKSKSHNGFAFAYFDTGAYFFQKKVTKGFEVIRCLPGDLNNGNFEFMTENGLTNVNKK